MRKHRGRIWDDFTPPDFDYKNKWLGKGGRKQPGGDFYDLTSEDLALANAKATVSFSMTVLAVHHIMTGTAHVLHFAGQTQHSMDDRRILKMAV